MSENEGSKKSFWQGIAAGLGAACIILLATVGISRTYQFLKESRQAPQESVTNEDAMAKLATLENTISQLYWEDVSEEALENGMYKGLLEALEDPYSVYYTQEELLQLRQDTEGIYYGIGAYISTDLESGYVCISKIIKNTPAEESDLEAGDFIYMINGEEMYGKDSSYVVSKIKGEENTYVTITVLRQGVADPIDIEVRRAKIESPTVEYTMYEDGVAYILISEFDDVTTKQFANAYAQAKKDGMKGMILDLRSNPGGNLVTVCDIARMLLPKGLIVYTEDKYGKRFEYTCEEDNHIEVPLVVLTNEYSASASEILAGAIKDYELGTLMGTTTFGKGIVQKVITLSDGSAVKLTISKYFTPKGNYIHNTGIEPDIVVEFDAQQYREGVDNQLEEAKIYISKLINE